MPRAAGRGPRPANFAHAACGQDTVVSCTRYRTRTNSDLVHTHCYIFSFVLFNAHPYFFSRGEYPSHTSSAAHTPSRARARGRRLPASPAAARLAAASPGARSADPVLDGASGARARDKAVKENGAHLAYSPYTVGRVTLVDLYTLIQLLMPQNSNISIPNTEARGVDQTQTQSI